jgi:hypothetical protein
MNQVKSAASKPKGGFPNAKPDPLGLADAVPAEHSQTPRTPGGQEAEDLAAAPEAESVVHPNILAAGSGVTTTKNLLKKEPEDNTVVFNQEAQLPPKTYTQDEVDAILAGVKKNAAPLTSSVLPAPERIGDQWVAVKPSKTIAPYIGDRTWYLEKDKAVKVPRAVAQELARAGCIYPFFNF